MKKLIIIAACLTGALNFVNAQYEGENGQGLYVLNSSYSVDNEGRVSGKVLSFYNDGHLEEAGTYLMGERHGKWMKYSDSGILLNEGYYNMGKKDGVWM